VSGSFPFGNPIPRCVGCLYRTGLGVGRIAKMLRRSKASCWKWVKRRGLAESGRTQKARERQIRNTAKGANQIIMAEYKKEMRVINRTENHWIMHPCVLNLLRERALKKGREAYHAATEETKQARNFKSASKNKWKRHNDPRFRAIFYARKRVRNFCTQRGINKTFSVSKVTGCTKDHLRSHIESMFRDGMTWENHGRIWEIDHKTPLASAQSAEEVIPLCHWTNLQPLLVLENRNKRDKILLA
jgi:hypothetical protein